MTQGIKPDDPDKQKGLLAQAFSLQLSILNQTRI